ncbi:hypothetical protein ILYODFUR_021420, partial [Ilyodon furcidens]
LPAKASATDDNPEVKAEGSGSTSESSEKQTVTLKIPRSPKPPQPPVRSKGAQNVLLIPRDPHHDVISLWQLSVRARPSSNSVCLVFGFSYRFKILQLKQQH